MNQITNAKGKHLFILVFISLSVASTFMYSQNQLKGIWVGDGYECDGITGQQKIRITISGNNVIATKMTGDLCVPSGNITWKGKYRKNSFPVKFQVSNGPGTPLRWIDEQVIILNRSTLKSYGVTYRRNPKNVEVLTTKKAYAIDDEVMINVKYSGLPGNENDWISITPKSATKYTHYDYTYGKYFGEMEFDNDLPLGWHQARVYFDNNNVIKGSYDFIIEKDKFRAWLWDLKPSDLDKLAKILEKDIGEWIKFGNKKLSHASLNMITLRRARDEIQDVFNRNNQEYKIEQIKASLDHLNLMADVASLKMMLKFVTSPPNMSKAKSIAFYIANTSRKFAQYNLEKSKIEKAIEEQTTDSFKRAGTYISQLEKIMFSE